MGCARCRLFEKVTRSRSQSLRGGPATQNLLRPSRSWSARLLIHKCSQIYLEVRAADYNHQREWNSAEADRKQLALSAGALNWISHLPNFVEGKSNNLLKAAAQQVAENPGARAYNPLFIYGRSRSRQRRHLMEAVAEHLMRVRNTEARTRSACTPSASSATGKALQHNTDQRIQDCLSHVWMRCSSTTSNSSPARSACRLAFSDFNALLGPAAM